MTTIIQGEDVRSIALGVKVNRSATTLVQNTTTSLFTVSGGGIILTSFIGVVSTAVANTASLTAKFVHTPSGGSAGDLTAATGITNDGVGTIYSITTGIAADLISEQSPAGSEAPGVTYAPILTTPLYLPAGAIGVTVSNHDPGTGAVVYGLTYIPFDDAAAVSAT